MDKSLAEFVGTFALVFFGCGAAVIGGMGSGATAIDLLGHFDCATPSASYAAGIIAGWCRRGAVPDDEALLRAWKKFKRTKEFTV